jgi:predicted ATPase
MRLHALNNDRAGALRVYHAHVGALQRELNVEPSPAIREAYERLLRADSTQTRRTLNAPAMVAASPLIGRQREWEQLQAIWQRASQGHSHIAFVIGEAGIGKTRLAEEMLMWANQQGIATARTRAYATEARLSYAPVTEWLRSDAIRESLIRLDKVWLKEVSRLLPELLIQNADLPPPEPVNEYWQRRRFFEALARAVLSAPQPLVLLLDDLQWCDPETLEWLDFLLRFDPGMRLLIFGTARPEELDAKHPLMSLLLTLRNADQITEIELKPLDAAETARLAAHITHAEFDDESAMQLFRETEGNPLFVVEMARAEPIKDLASLNRQLLRSAGNRDLSSLRLPPRIYAVIAGRLARLSPAARDLAGLAATFGREFTFDVLARASHGDEDSLLQGLDELWQRRIVREQGPNEYDFSHDKIRDVVYAEISPMKQRHWHLRVAQALEVIHARPRPGERATGRAL